MKWTVCCAAVLLCCLAQPCDARVVPEGEPYEDPVAVPYWPYSASDFWRYVEYFRSIGAYNHVHELARAFFAHQAFGDTLGYGVPEGHEH